MANKLLNSGIAAIFLLSLPLFCGCASKSPNYYVLHSLQSEAPGVKTARAESDLTIGVGPIKIPEYLDRPQMATRSTPNSLEFAEFDKWAEPLDKNLASVLAENLSILLSTDRVVVFPWVGSRHVLYQVTVDVAQMEYTPDGKAVLVAGWSVFGNDGDKLLETKRSRIIVPVQSTGFEAVASAQSRAVGDMSREIAACIESLPREQEIP
ncbi:MAG: membrane integrity-associated transporter subunit PqiC [Syntrophobacteraceae bacterium]